MKLGGWILLIFYWTIIISTLVFCFIRMFSGKETKKMVSRNGKNRVRQK